MTSIWLYLKAYAPWSYMIAVGGVLLAAWIVGYALGKAGDARRMRVFRKKYP